MAVLLVEGATDVDFFTALLPRVGISRDVDVKPPRTFGRPNTVTVFAQLLDTLIAHMANGQIDGLGIIADADHVSGGGFANRWTAITARLKSHGYRIPQRSPALPYTGSVFRHSDGLPDVGLWIMPDHQNNGMLEDFIKASASNTPDQTRLLAHADTTINRLPVQLFTRFQATKACVYSWLAWQKRPGQGLDIALDASLIDHQSPSMRGLIVWLRKTFSGGKGTPSPRLARTPMWP